MQHHRQQRAQQELRVVPRRIDQHDRLGDERSDAGGLRRPARRGRRLLHRSRKAVAQARRRHARGGQELLVVEGDDLRAPPGLEVALEIGRNIDGGDGFTGTDGAGGGGEIARALNDAETGRRGHLFHEHARGVGSVRVDDDHPEFTNDRMAEHRGQDREGKHGHGEDQNARGVVTQQPPPFALGDEPEARLWRRLHRRCCHSIYALMPGRSSGTFSTG